MFLYVGVVLSMRLLKWPRLTTPVLEVLLAAAALLSTLTRLPVLRQQAQLQLKSVLFIQLSVYTAVWAVISATFRAADPNYCYFCCHLSIVCAYSAYFHHSWCRLCCCVQSGSACKSSIFSVLAGRSSYHNVGCCCGHLFRCLHRHWRGERLSRCLIVPLRLAVSDTAVRMPPSVHSHAALLLLSCSSLDSRLILAIVPMLLSDPF